MQFQIITDWGLTGLTGTLTYELRDAANSVIVGATHTGIVEYPIGSGLYYVIVTWNPDWTGIKAVWSDGVRSTHEWFDPPTSDLFVGPDTITLVFKTALGANVPNTPFTILGIGSGLSDSFGTRTLNIPSGTYDVQVLPTGGNTWNTTSITVSGDATFTLTANPVSIPSVPVLSYSSIGDASTYFQGRLYSDFWFASTDTNQQRALNSATALIDRFNYKGRRTVIDQLHEFPRSDLLNIDSSLIPQDIFNAQYEIAFSLLNGYDPERDSRSFGITSRAYSTVRIAYDPKHLPEYIQWGIPSLAGWQYLIPYLNFKANGTIKLHRVA